MKSVNITVNGISAKGELIISQGEIIFNYNDYCIIKKGDYPFVILKEIREELEKRGILLIINGSRKDVYPSGMSLASDKAYIQHIGKTASLEDIVNIFEETEHLELIGTVEEQFRFHTEWINSF